VSTPKRNEYIGNSSKESARGCYLLCTATGLHMSLASSLVVDRDSLSN